MKPTKAKARTKKNNAKFARVKFATKDNVAVSNPDFTNLRKPVDISVSSLCQVTKLLENGSDEVKSVLSYECDIIYECRVCHSLYRSLVNFISHKRVYCKEKFNITMNKNLSHDYEMIFDKGSLACVQEPEQTVFKGNCSNDRILRSHAPREENRKDLTAVIDMLQQKQQKNSAEKVLDLKVPNGSVIVATGKGQMRFENMDTNTSAMYQTSIDSMEMDSTPDLMKAQILEIENMLKHETVLLEQGKQQLQSNQSEKSDSPLQIYGSDDESESVVDTLSIKNLMCSICNAIFATKKTLAVHVKTLHTPHRMCYPCPCCPSIFTNTWSVYRHLFKVHRKSNEQVRKLRNQIQEKAFRKETATAEDLGKETQITTCSLSRNLLRINETQEWIDHLESDSELQRCGGCGKRFDRKAALSSHSQYCQRRIAACNDSSVSNKMRKSSKVSPELRADSKITQNAIDTSVIVNPKRTISERTCGVVSEPNQTNEISIRVQAVSTLSKADWDKIDSGQPLSTDLNEIDMINISSNTAPSSDISSHPTESHSTDRRIDSSPYSDVSDAPEIIFTKLDNFTATPLVDKEVASPVNNVVSLNGGSKKRKLSCGRRITPRIETPEKTPVKSVTNTNSVALVNLSNKEPTNKKDQSAVMEDKIAAIANLRKLQCVPCKRKFTSMTNLRRHIAIHIGWNRYSCKLCDFKCFVKCDCVAHCNKMHNAQNNRALIADMIMEISPDQYTCNQDIIIDVTNLEDTAPEQGKESRTTVESKDQTVEPSAVVDKTVNENSISANVESSDTSITKDDKVVETVSEVVVQQADPQDAKTDSEKNETRDENAVKNTSKKKDQDCMILVSTNSQLGRLDSDPDLRRMVMEVIFGSTEVNPEKLVKQRFASSENNNVNSEKKSLDSGENITMTSGSEDSKESSVSLGHEDSKPQRPVRNRIKPVNKDFIYDLKEVAFRKESVTLKTTLAANKVLMKKPFVRLQASECNIDIRGNDPLKSHKNIESVGDRLLASCNSDVIGDRFDVSSASLKNSFNLSQVDLVQNPELTVHAEK